MRVTVLTPVLNEERHVREAVAGMQRQRPGDDVEFLLIDGGSSDGTQAILRALAADDPRIRLLDNPGRTTPRGLNVGLRHARGEFVARMDAHTLYPPDYLSLGVARLREGDADWVCGPQLAHGVGTWSQRVALATSTWLGIGGATFRLEADREFDVDTGFTGIWRRETLEELGGWAEGWPINQDSEMAARIRERGGRIVCLPGMAALYVPRDGLRTLARQYFRYGTYRAKTARHHPISLRRSHVLAPGLAVTVVLASIAPRAVAGPARAGLAAYAATVATMAVRTGRSNGGNREVPGLALVFATLHLSWGFGFLAGSVRFGPPLAALARVAGLAHAGSPAVGAPRASRDPMGREDRAAD